MKGISTALIACALGCLVQRPAATAQTETVLYAFCSQQDASRTAGFVCTDGIGPVAGVIDVNGTLYGTTSSGGAQNDGALFSLNLTNDAETVLYSFCSQRNCTDGEYPIAGVIDINGTLYGTTAYGGSAGCDYGCGTVYSLNLKTGAETVLHSFQMNGTDGVNPDSTLIGVHGTLYGTTVYGGTGDCSGYGCGTVYSLDPNTGAESVLYSFCSHEHEHCKRGAYPEAAVIDAKGRLYGTTNAGGSGGCSGGCGTVFSVDLKTGAEKVLYSFRSDGTDGEYPLAGVIDVHGTLYGTTVGGGTGSCSGGCGTVFALNLKTRAEEVLHSFQYDGTDGVLPYGGVIGVDDTLYGTTFQGGTSSDCYGYGCGTVYSLNLTTGAETVLHSFQENTDGVSPEDALISVEGTLYGTTYGGGAYSAGTVFSIVP